MKLASVAWKWNCYSFHSWWAHQCRGWMDFRQIFRFKDFHFQITVLIVTLFPFLVSYVSGDTTMLCLVLTFMISAYCAITSASLIFSWQLDHRRCYRDGNRAVWEDHYHRRQCDPLSFCPSCACASQSKTETLCSTRKFSSIMSQILSLDWLLSFLWLLSSHFQFCDPWIFLVGTFVFCSEL